MNNTTQTTNENSANTVFLTELKKRINRKIGPRILGRLSKLLDIEHPENYTDNALVVAIRLASDIDYQHPEHTRSQKVMAYRKANKQFDILAAAIFAIHESMQGSNRLMFNDLAEHLLSSLDGNLDGVDVQSLRDAALQYLNTRIRHG